MKKILFLLVCLAASMQVIAKDVKYIFYMIGDGMGLSVIAATEYYKAAVNGKVGTEPLNFHYFPVASYATAYNAEREISDSGSSGTALATGQKTAPGHIGTDANGNPLTNLSEVMSKDGRQIGIITSAKINDATPSVFYGHQPSRSNYMKLVEELTDSPYAFIAGNTFYCSGKAEKEKMLDLIRSKKTLIRSLDEYETAKDKADRIVFVPTGKSHFKLAINRRDSDGSTTLSECLKTTIDFLEAKDKLGKGFFIMAEGGEIDHTAHKNDMAATIKETIDFEDAVAVAIEFYNRHPEETAILVVSDHDTGGACMIGKEYSKYTLLNYQTSDISAIASEFAKKFKKNPDISWEEYKQFMSERTGMWGKIKVEQKDEKKIKSIYESTIGKGNLDYKSDEYKYGVIPAVIKETFKAYNRYAGFTWGHNSHTACYVPVFYQGPQPELFRGPLDNTSFFEILKKVAGL